MSVSLKLTIGLLVLLLVAVGALWTPDKSRSVLEARYLQGGEDLREVDGVRLHLRVSGPPDAPALFLLHGFGASLHTWDAWARALEDRYRVIRMDLPGAGLSHPDPSGDYSDERTLALMAAIMEDLAVARVVLIGNSIGGRLAWRFAAAYPGRVSGLVLISPDGFASEGFEYGKAPEVSAMTELMRYTLPRFLLEMSLRPAYGNPEILTDAVVSRYHDLMLAPGSRDALIKRMAQTVLVDPRPLLSRIPVPVLLLWGEEDGAIPIENAADYQANLPDSRLVTLPGLGHVPQEEDPVRSLAPVSAFLESLNLTSSPSSSPGIS
ncbi:alpha/beta fold hydrolase [Congregibacter litoralis]|uniref:alpha/beta fold hydrolase n=1 Tax=Congregibacter litoralis TaxID=393662 RepID=UPI0003077906|nr:alpha/beta hydrolase [Congregibacter litoralis]